MRCQGAFGKCSRSANSRHQRRLSSPVTTRFTKIKQNRNINQQSRQAPPVPPPPIPPTHSDNPSPPPHGAPRHPHRHRPHHHCPLPSCLQHPHQHRQALPQRPSVPRSIPACAAGIEKGEARPLTKRTRRLPTARPTRYPLSPEGREPAVQA